LEAILGISHVIQIVLQSETCSLSGGDHLWFKRRGTREKRAVTRQSCKSNNNNTLTSMLKYAYLIDVAIPNSHNLHSTVTDTHQKYTELKKRASKKMTTENSRYSTNSTILIVRWVAQSV